MKPSKKYASAAAFRVALEDRLKRLALEESRLRPFALPPVCQTGRAVAVERWLRDGIAPEDGAHHPRH